MNKGNVFLISLGCDKNLVDSEQMLGSITDAGYTLVNDEAEADYIIVNTCSFIHDAKEESVNTILEMGELKSEGLKGLIGVGCLTQRYQNELAELIPELDGMLGATNYDEIVDVLENIEDGEKYFSFNDINYKTKITGSRISDFTTRYGYLKISDGCNNRCAFCIIPSLRGDLKSRSKNELIKETENLVAQEKREVVIVAQDTLKYGLDLYHKRAFTELVDDLSKIDGLKWIRLMYCYPEDVTDEVIELIKTNDKVVHYLDTPIQHVSDKILKSMRRRTNKKQIYSMIEKLRREVPDIIIRTSLIVGYPGETEEDFAELRDFVAEGHIDKVGVFTYSKEENTAADLLDNQVDEETKTRRRDELMKIAQELTFYKNRRKVGSTYEVLIEGFIVDEDVYVGRTFEDAPKVDSMVFVNSDEPLLVGSYVKVKITDFSDYDLIGEFTGEIIY